ncbi:hypothetical protein [Blastococcus sp. URHD0036]|uniref:hypothetical protein n=1 Tax=Blastococcus sp. URHD0036 TaxID=1380356 RepID=UPI000497DA7B|nr:hypothetical protein [Blastococcus sp. URHD0036]
MSSPKPGAPDQGASPTVRLDRPPPLAAEPASPPPSLPARPGHPDDMSTVGLPRPTSNSRHRTFEFGVPEPVKVTVTARPRRQRRFSTWPWIVGVLLALLVLAAVLVGMLLGGSTIDDPRLDGPGDAGLPGASSTAPGS